MPVRFALAARHQLNHDLTNRESKLHDLTASGLVLARARHFRVRKAKRLPKKGPLICCMWGRVEDALQRGAATFWHPMGFELGQKIDDRPPTHYPMRPDVSQAPVHGAACLYQGCQIGIACQRRTSNGCAWNRRGKRDLHAALIQCVLVIKRMRKMRSYSMSPGRALRII